MDIRQRSKKRRKPTVNIVPMVDVLTVLIFFFLITMQFKQVNAVDITPPTMQSSENVNSKDFPNVIAVKKDGSCFLNDKKVLPEALIDEFKTIAANNKNASFILLSDKDTPFQSVANVIDKAAIAKIKRLSLQAKKEN
ncbi:MAG: biopolymer transporter ExbD [Opitutales bacterium]|nr:biopolymer transporter ExbD [Opitutales bacterium]